MLMEYFMSMLKKHVLVQKLLLSLNQTTKVRKSLRYFTSSYSAINIYLGLSKADIERHIKYVESNANCAAKSGQYEKRINDFFNYYCFVVYDREPNDPLYLVRIMSPSFYNLICHIFDLFSARW